MSRTLVRVYLCLLIVVAPLPLGSNREWAGYLMLAATLGVTALLCLYLALRRRRENRRDHVLAPMLALLVWLVLVLVQILNGQPPASGDLLHAVRQWPGWLPFTIDPAASHYQGLLGLLYLLVFALTVHAVRSSRHARFLLGAIVVSALVQCAIGVYEQLHRIDLLGLGERFGVINGSFVNRNHFAGFIAAAAAIAIAILARRLTVHHHYVPGRRRNLLIRWIDVFTGSSAAWIIVAGFTLSIIAASGSRGATFSTAAAAIAGLLWLALISRRERRFAVGIYLAVVAILASVALYDTLLLTRAADLLDQARTEGRLLEWRVAIDAILTRPLTGYGAGSYTDALAPHRDGTLASLTYNHAHNHYLELALETGLFGLLPLAVFCVLVIVAAATTGAGVSAQRAEASFAALLAFLTLLFHAVVEFNLKIPAITIALHMAAGIIIGLAGPPPRTAGGGREMGTDLFFGKK